MRTDAPAAGSAAVSVPRVTPWLRLLRRPGFALAVIITLALGIGANTVTFELIYGELLAPLPYVRAGELVNLYFTARDLPGNQGMSYRTYQDLRAHVPAIADAGMIGVQSFNLSAGSQVAHVRGALISPSLLSTLGVLPLLGRAFGGEASLPGAAPQVLLSERFWAQLYGRDPQVAGRTLRLNDQVYTVLGVMPARFALPDPDIDLWVARIVAPSDVTPDMLTAWGDTLIVRLKPGVSLGELQAQAQTVLDREIATFSADSASVASLRRLEMRMAATPLRTLLVGDLGDELVLAQLATLLLLVLIWFNLANLFIARALQQRGDLALRRVLGARTGVLFRELLRESLTLCLVGSLAGWLLGRLGMRVLLAVGFAVRLPPAGGGFLDAGLVLLLAALSALVLALAGVYFIHRQGLAQALKDMDVRSSGGRGERRVRSALVVTQLSLACVLTALGLMLTHSLIRLGTLELGFQPQNLLTFQLALPEAVSSSATLQRQLTQLRQTLAAVPGVTAVTLASGLPFDGGSTHTTAYPYPSDGRHEPNLTPVVIDDGYFRTLSLPLLRGRLPQLTAAGVAAEAAVDRQAAQELFGSTDVVGREISLNKADDTRKNMHFRISGVVGATRRAYGDERGSGSVYLYRDQLYSTTGPDRGWSWMDDTWYIAVRTPLTAAAILPALRQGLQRTFPNDPIYDVRTMQERMAAQLSAPRDLAALVLIFAAGALVVASVGVYAVASYSVSQRRAELGIRAALGADPGRLRQLVLREARNQLLAGIPLGLAGALILGRLFAQSLPGAQGVDLPSLGAMALVLTLVTLLAGWVPAWRASQVSPMEALREH